ncbi:nitrate- and nitrite sensing domain-containing protein [Shewanella sp. C32]|uniref:Nitrate- and nitrite sensing domain-containing protein n=1 Tax=Shewanella electrica TaxID=515560 RepID=A0ABT2FPC8_9GAMM|nr:nitrate- and nitrite sensing domain-containing protein [Shewanella electrica]MCH1923838.1 nitrate- and nitrite sensing domain-containing protein [Shewanella electrica]MCS4557056.1 nitrate- and nitrite sensing domain-containing protein [Shewanella electrica]
MNFQWIGNLSIKIKFLLVILPPLLLALLFGSIDIWHNVSSLMDTKRVLNLSHLVNVQSNLVHELQKERGMSAGYLGSNGVAFATALPNQRKLTDKQLEIYQQYTAERHFSEAMTERINQINSELVQLDNIRKRVYDQQITVPEEVAYYNKLNSALLALVDLVVKAGEDKKIAVEAASFSSYLQMKERAGIERAVLSATFGNRDFKPGAYKGFITLVAEQQSFEKRFMALTPQRLLSQYQQLLQDPKIAQVEQLRNIAFERNSDELAQQKPEDWFAASTARIELLRQFELVQQQDLETSTQTHYAALLQATWFEGGIIVAGLLLILLFSYVVIHNMLSRLTALHHGIGQAKQNFDMTSRVVINGNDEIGEIGMAFNAMLTDFDGVIASVRNNANTLNLVVNRINEYSHQLTENVAIGYSESEQVASAMTQMSSTVQEIASSAVKVTDATKVASQEAKEGNLEVCKTADAISELASEIETASQSIQQLDADIHSIVGLLEEINGIAEQTNLLALNAAIEAARAGEMGRGFAVVADEVRNLAQRSQSSTEDIRKMTDRLKVGAQQAVTAIGKGKQRAESSVKEANRAGEELYQIVTQVELIESMNEQIAAATHEQSIVSEDVNRNALRISETYSSTKQIADEFADLNKSLQQDAENLKRQVQKFKTSLN